MKYECGCINETHEPSGILHCVRKCREHAAKYHDPAAWGQSCYEAFGIIRDGVLQSTAHVEELEEALGAFPEPLGGKEDCALEVGCGVSPYVRAIQRAGWFYMGIDSSQWAVEWARGHHGPTQFIGIADDFETLEIEMSYGLILAAHCIEHMYDVPAAIAKMARLIEPGGDLWIIVPDDSDPTNPDHWWFFTESTLLSTIEAAGLHVIYLAVRKYVPHENFLYCRARKP